MLHDLDGAPTNMLVNYGLINNIVLKHNFFFTLWIYIKEELITNLKKVPIFNLIRKLNYGKMEWEWNDDENEWRIRVFIEFIW